MELPVAAVEGGVGEDAAPGRADGGGADEALGVVRRDAQEDLAHGVVDQRRRRTAAALRRRRQAHGERIEPALGRRTGLGFLSRDSGACRGTGERQGRGSGGVEW